MESRRNGKGSIQGSEVVMGAPFETIDLHGMRREEAIRVIDKAIAGAGTTTYQIRIIHGYNRGTNLRSMIYDEYRYDTRIKRIIPGDNQGITVLVMKELF